jgi:hypothetical protein
MNVPELAIPATLVIAVVEVTPVKKPPAPAVGAVNITVAPWTGLPAPSRTVAASAEANGVFTVALCILPEATLIDAGGPVAPATVTNAVTAGMYGGTLAVMVVVPGLCGVTITTDEVNALPSG